MAKVFRYSFNEGGEPWVRISNDDSEIYHNESAYPFSWFATQEPGYSLPAQHQYIYHEYYQGNYNRAFTKTDQMEAPQGFPWAAGDIYISKKAEYDAAYALHINTPPTLEEAKTVKINSLIAKMVETKKGGVIFNSVTYDSGINYERLNLAWLDTLRGNPLPIDFYINDINRNQITFNQSDLENLLSKIHELHYLCDLNFDIHFTNIMALTGIDFVEDYNINTDWVTVPYV
jgi:hypothetical protein